MIGEEPNGIPANLMPFISKVATKELNWKAELGLEDMCYDAYMFTKNNNNNTNHN